MTPKKVRSVTSQKYKTIKKTFHGIKFNLLAKQSGFKKRKTKKISGEVLLITFLMMALKGTNTFQSWSEEAGLQANVSVSRQGLWKRMNSFFVKFVYKVLTEVFSGQIKAAQTKIRPIGKLKKYNRILLQDSTMIHLPSWLVWCYPGNYSRGDIKALIKIQIVFDLLSNKIIHFEITPYSKNDQSMSKMILPIAVKGDLVIRDLGYFALETFEGMNENKASYITRLKPRVKIYNVKNGKQIDLVRILKLRGKIDCWALVGKERQVKMRIVAERLPDEVANEKIRKAKNSRDKRLNHDKEYYELMRYRIYLTNIPYKEINTTRISQVYSLRWRIENIFKNWKSYLKLQSLIPANVKMTKYRVEAILYMMMIFIIQFQFKIYSEIIKFVIKNKLKVEVSLAKWTNLLSQRFSELISLSPLEIISFAIRYCKYDKRKDRINFNQNPFLS